jgi:flagellar biosynthesis chaperone FliJ
MSSAKLAKLESLAELQAESSKKVVERQRLELSQIDQHHSDLNRINLDYQNGVIGVEDMSPQYLAHRRGFVSGLSTKLDMLREQRKQKTHVFEESVRESRKHNARTAALSALVERSKSNEQLSTSRQEEKQQSDTLQALRHINLSKEEDDHA